MKRWLIEQGYRICLRGDWIGDLWARFFLRWYCPHPCLDDWTARACIAAGHCGCNNRSEDTP